METTADAIVATVAVEGPVDSAETLTESDPLVEDELLVEEISIDGMCGVY